MNIVFLSFYSGLVDRGVETYVYEVARRLVRNHKVSVYQMGSKKGAEPFKVVTVPVALDKTVPDRKYPLLWRLFLDYWSLRKREFAKLALSLLPGDTDVVFPMNGGWESLLAKRWTMSHHRRLVISGQSGKGWDDRINLICRPDIFVALSNIQRKWALANGFGVRVEKIPNGVDTERFNLKVAPAGIELPGPIFLCVAALEKDKRIDLVIEAVARVKKGSLLVIGSGDQKERLEEIGRRLLPDHFAILSVSHEKMPGYYRAANVFTMVPVRTESFGIAYLEAMASGRPVVATDDPIRREIVGDAGLFVDPMDGEKYAAALEEALSIDWGSKPRRQAEKFSWDDIALGYEELLRSSAV